MNTFIIIGNYNIHVLMKYNDMKNEVRPFLASGDFDGAIDKLNSIAGNDEFLKLDAKIIISRVHYSAEKTDEAKQMANESLEESIQLKLPLAEFRSHIMISYPLVRRKLYSEAMNHLNLIPGIYENLSENQKLESQTDYGDSLNIKGLIYFYQSKYKTAKTIFEELSKFVESNNLDISIKTQAITNIGICNSELGLFNLAINNNLETLEYAREKNDRWRTATILEHLSFNYLSKGEFNSARTVMQESLTIRNEMGLKRHIASSMMRFSELEEKLGEIDKAIDFNESAIELYKEEEDIYLENVALSNFAELIINKGQISTSLNILDGCINKFEELGSTKDVAEVYERKGKIQVILGNYEGAIQLFEKSKQIYLDIDNQASIATIFSHLGDTKWLLGYIEEARDYLQESLSIRYEIDNIQLIADSKIRLGKLHSSLGEFAIAKNHITEGLKLQEIYDNKIELANSIYCLANYIQPINLNELTDYQTQLQILSQSNPSKKIRDILRFIDLLIISQESFVETDLESLQIELKTYLQNNDLPFEVRLNAMVLLSKTLISLFSNNFKLTTLKSLSEIIEDLITFADEQNSFIVSLQARLLNVKLSIVDFKLKHAENLILEGQKIAEDKQLNYILDQFRDEQIFIEQIKFKWEKRDENSIGLEERFTESNIIQVISEKSGSWGAIPNFYSK